MASLKDLIAQKEALELEIERARKQNRSEAVAKVRALMDEYGLTSADLVVRRGPKPGGGTGAKVPAKYRNAATGDAWSGRGLQPKWLKAALATGRKLSDFAV
jgi:DNA-binding protein H-NS